MGSVRCVAFPVITASGLASPLAYQIKDEDGRQQYSLQRRFSSTSRRPSSRRVRTSCVSDPEIVRSGLAFPLLPGANVEIEFAP